MGITTSSRFTRPRITKCGCFLHKKNRGREKGPKRWRQAMVHLQSSRSANFQLESHWHDGISRVIQVRYTLMFFGQHFKSESMEKKNSYIPL